MQFFLKTSDRLGLRALKQKAGLPKEFISKAVAPKVGKTALIASSALMSALFIVSNAGAQQAAGITKAEIAQSLTLHAKKNRFPSSLQVQTSMDSDPIRASLNYTFDEQAHKDLAKVYLRYQPDYACFVAIDAQTGAILNLTSFIKDDEQWDNLVLRSDYPAASVFKMITAAASLDMGKLSPGSIIPYNGKSTTLYKGQVLRHRTNKWTREPSLKESFAKSVNSVFARIGIFDVGATKLREYAQKFGFDQPLSSDFLLPKSKLSLSLENQWEVAEAASGYTKDITLSPIHAAQMAAIIVNNGKMVSPYMVESARDQNGQLLYKAESKDSQTQVISAQTAKSMRALMQETTRIGSARKSFSNLKRYKVYKDMEIGGKTGSLTGYSPRGRHDWFVGYAQKDGRKIAFASLIINKEKWVVRSSYVARQFIYNYFTALDAPTKNISSAP